MAYSGEMKTCGRNTLSKWVILDAAAKFDYSLLEEALIRLDTYDLEHLGLASYNRKPPEWGFTFQEGRYIEYHDGVITQEDIKEMIRKNNFPCKKEIIGF